MVTGRPEPSSDVVGGEPAEPLPLTSSLWSCVCATAVAGLLRWSAEERVPPCSALTKVLMISRRAACKGTYCDLVSPDVSAELLSCGSCSAHSSCLICGSTSTRPASAANCLAVSLPGASSPSSAAGGGAGEAASWESSKVLTSAGSEGGGGGSPPESACCCSLWPVESFAKSSDGGQGAESATSCNSLATGCAWGDGAGSVTGCASELVAKPSDSGANPSSAAALCTVPSDGCSSAPLSLAVASCCTPAAGAACAASSLCSTAGAVASFISGDALSSRCFSAVTSEASSSLAAPPSNAAWPGPFASSPDSSGCCSEADAPSPSPWPARTCSATSSCAREAAGTASSISGAGSAELDCSRSRPTTSCV
mmetsp:Transcript_25930/g.60580  ORF Transcript_25930/g.60580 Transcript_25930/m.60580 type:complete len:368 (-) Transcript_25930:156-1259(-)